MGRMKFSSRLHGWLFPYVGPYNPTSTFTWQECPFCGSDTLPFEPTRPFLPGDPDGD